MYIDGEGGKKIGIWVDGKRMEWVVGFEENEFYKDFMKRCDDFERKIICPK